MKSRTDLLLGQIALDRGLISQEQLDAALKAQEESPQWKQLGMIFLDQKFMTEEELELVLEVQRKNLESTIDNTDLKLKDVLFGRIVVARRLATQGQVNVCLREQEQIERMGIFLRLGEIMVKKGFLSQQSMEEILGYQNKKLEEFREEALGDGAVIQDAPEEEA